MGKYEIEFIGDDAKYPIYEEILMWNTDELKKIITERIRVSIGLSQENDETIWNDLFSEKPYRSGAKAEKYIIDRTFKRPRDIISFVRFCLENAIKNNHDKIENEDTQLAEEEKYSLSKYKDLIIEYKRQLPFIQNLLDSFSGSLHRISQEELIKHLEKFLGGMGLKKQNANIMVRNLFVMGFIGVKKFGRSGVKQKGGIGFYYYYDDPSINPLSSDEYYIHPSLRYHLNIKEKRKGR